LLNKQGPVCDQHHSTSLQFERVEQLERLWCSQNFDLYVRTKSQRIGFNPSNAISANTNNDKLGVPFEQPSDFFS